MRREISIDWVTIILYLILVLFGWLNLYSTSLPDGGSVFDLNTFHGKQLVFVAISVVLGVLTLSLDSKFIEFISYVVYGIAIALLVLVVLIATTTKGASSWFKLGAFSIQPTEIAKLATLLALSKFMSRFNYSMNKPSDLLISGAIVIVPILLILLQNDAGSALVFTSLIFVFYREGLHPIILIVLFLSGVVGAMTIFMDEVTYYQFIIISFIVGVTLVSMIYFKGKYLGFHLVALLYFSLIVVTISVVTKPYQRLRFKVLLLDEDEVKGNRDLEAAIYNLRHSKVAIGSGGLTGKGYGNATHTKGDFVPEEHTDYIFCVLSEEHGWIGSSVIIVVFFLFLARLVYISENSKNKYARIFGYGTASVFFFHMAINIGMTIGLVPTIGIPLPFLSYGGSSMIAFSLMTFIVINNYSYRGNVLGT